jgi:putative transposon-encoded protein
MKAKLCVTVEVSEVLTAMAKQFGTGAHVIVPKEWAGKKVKVALLDEGERDTKKDTPERRKKRSYSKKE